MEERKVVNLKKEEFSIREDIKNMLGKGKISKVKIVYTPVGEKVIIFTHKPGLVIGRRGERIDEISRFLKTKFNLENPNIEIEEVKIPEFDAQIQADEIALSLERFGPLKFKVIAYKALQKIINAGAIGVEIRLNGKLPSARAKSWRFSYGYLKKTGEPSKLVDRAQSRAETKPGTVGIKVAILTPNVELKDKINISKNLIKEIKQDYERLINEQKEDKQELNKRKMKKQK